LAKALYEAQKAAEERPIPERLGWFVRHWPERERKLLRKYSIDRDEFYRRMRQGLHLHWPTAKPGHRKAVKAALERLFRDSS
jgi:hypothetical protein